MSVYKTRKEVIETHIKPTDAVLDVGFWGQAVKRDDPNWLHKVLKDRAKEVYGVDIAYDESEVENPEHYQKASAENFHFENKQFDVIYASEIIEHLSNPGLFLSACRENIKPDGKLIITTPNAYNFFSMTEKLFKREPSVNPDHTMYFNHVVLKKLLEKNNWAITEQSYIDTFPSQSSPVRKILHIKYRSISFFTDKYSETLMIVARQNPNT